jgi:hypothetical protein
MELDAPEMSGIANSMAMKFTALSVALALAAAVFVMGYPFYSSLDGDFTLVGENGSWVLIPVLLPVIVAAVPLAFHKRVMRIMSSVVHGAFVLIAGYPIGLCYLPAAVAMVVAATRENPKRDPYITRRHRAA